MPFIAFILRFSIPTSLLILIAGSHGLLAEPRQSPGPEQVVVVAHARNTESQNIARYYMEKRGIPERNLFLVDPPDSESISWRSFSETIYNPLLRRLTEAGFIEATTTALKDDYGRLRYIRDQNKIGYLVLCYGLPLRIAVDKALSGQEAAGKNLPDAQRNQASVDAELALLVFSGSPCNGFVRNPAFGQKQPWGGPQGAVVRVARLDGPSYASVKTMIDNTLIAEQEGLRGHAYLDTGGPHSRGDQWINAAGTVLRQLGYGIETADQSERFNEGSRFDAPAFYFGWYATHVDGPFNNDGFRFPPGAIAVHIHSYSANTIRSDSKRWCGPFVARGVTATLGNVYEPFLEYTHNLEYFMQALADGYTLGEAAYYSLPVLSWQATLIGDPLYRPFKQPLDKQLDNLRDGSSTHESPLLQYAVIRQINLLHASGQTGEALALAADALSTSHGLALKLRYAELLADHGKTRQAKELLQTASKLRILNVDDWGLLKNVALKLDALGDSKGAFEVMTTLLQYGNCQGQVRLYMLETASQLARQAGKSRQASDWDAESHLLRSQLSEKVR